jgi:quercetin dioxygenase-like cupin family protein
MGTMSSKESLVVKSVKNPDEKRPFKDNKGHADVVQLDGGSVLCGTFEPGWRWSQHVKPIVGTNSCQANHLGYVLSGRMRIKMDDGKEAEIGPGDTFRIPPGHDAWVVGNEACVLVDFGGYSQYGKPVAPSSTAGGASAHSGPPRK